MDIINNIVTVSNPADVLMVSSAELAECQIRQELAQRRTTVVLGTTVLDVGIALTRAHAFIRDAEDEGRAYNDGADLSNGFLDARGVYSTLHSVVMDRGESFDEEDAMIARIDRLRGQSDTGLAGMPEELNEGLTYAYANPPKQAWIRCTRNPAYTDHLPPRKQHGGSSPRLGLRVENGQSAQRHTPRAKQTHSVSGKGVDVSALKLRCKSCKCAVTVLPFFPKHTAVNCTSCHTQRAQPQQGGRRR